MLVTEFAEYVYQNLAKNKPEATAGIDRVAIGALADDALSEFATRMIMDLARSMLDAHIHRIIVVDNNCRPIGIVSSTDILAAVAYLNTEEAELDHELVSAKG